MTLEKYVKELADEGQPLKHSGLLQLSGLSSDELFEFKSAWMTLPSSRKKEVLSRLVELGEDNIELDFSAIFRACLKDDDPEIRETATRGLWECDDRVLIRPLVSILEADPAPRVRAAAALALGKFASMAQDGKLMSRDGERIRNALLDVIGRDGEDMEVRRRALEAVASFNTPDIESLIREAYHSSDSRMKQSAIFAMGRSSNSHWLPTVLEEASSPDPAIRYEAANAIGLLGDESAIPILIRLVRDPDVQVQLSSINSLGMIGGPVAKRALQEIAKSGDETIEEAAEEALKSLEFDEDPLGFKFDVGAL